MWLQVGTRWLNMDRALLAEDDATSTPPGLAVTFADGVKRVLMREERDEVLAWLQQHCVGDEGLARALEQCCDTALDAFKRPGSVGKSLQTREPKPQTGGHRLDVHCHVADVARFRTAMADALHASLAHP